jgi:hypothetical protein
MSRKQNAGAPPSLAQHFDAPDDYIGTFGWLCGYSADAPFLDDAAERFTRLIGSRRAYQGRIVLAAMLDPGNPAITLLDAPGVAHLPIKDVVNKPFRLLHAKVALLGFRHQENHDRWLLRLLVSTGNWTQQTLEKNLDLAWRIDASSESLINPDSNTRLDCADIKAAWNLLEWIQEYFDLRLLNTSIADRTAEAAQAFDQVQRWIATCEKNAQGRPRFFDSRKYSLLQQLPEKIQTDKATRRNYLALGSGFYETSKKPERAPEVPMAILERLRDEKLLTENADIDLYINPKSCQAIESSFEPLDEAGFTIRPSATPATVFGELSQRDLHAKFLFSCNCREDSASCSSPWVYLGSGNLTHAGFVNKMNPAGGNLEAGVVFSPGALFWYGNRTTSSDQVITNLLQSRGIMRLRMPRPYPWDQRGKREKRVLSPRQSPGLSGGCLSTVSSCALTIRGTTPLKCSTQMARLAQEPTLVFNGAKHNPAKSLSAGKPMATPMRSEYRSLINMVASAPLHCRPSISTKHGGNSPTFRCLRTMTQLTAMAWTIRQAVLRPRMEARHPLPATRYAK